jgi:hypothetical protein
VARHAGDERQRCTRRPRRPPRSRRCPRSARSWATCSPRGGRGCRDAGDRRGRGVTVGHPSLRRPRHAVLVLKQGDSLDRVKFEVGPHHLPHAAARVRPRGHVPVVHRLGGLGQARLQTAQTRGAHSRPPRRGVHRHQPRRPLRPEEVRHPYIRDYLLNRGVLADVSETSAPWGALPRLYDNVMAAARSARRAVRARRHHVPPFALLPRGSLPLLHVCAHPSERRDPLEQYDLVKSPSQQTFIDSGATLLHHHAFGAEHARWLEEDISAPGVAMVRALFDRMDPGAKLNPFGKIV